MTREKFIPPEKGKIPEAVSRPVELGGERFELREFNIGRPPEGGVISPGVMEIGNTRLVMERYRADPLLVTRQFKGRYGTTVPYTFLHKERQKIYGDYTTPKGQDEFKGIDLALTKDPFMPPPDVKELWDFAAAKLRRRFTTDQEMACIRGLAIKKGKLTVTVGPGLYSQSFYSNGAEGLSLGITTEERMQLCTRLSVDELDNLERWAKRLKGRYGEGRTIRDVLYARYSGMPPFEDHVYNNSIGVAGMVLTEKDEQFIYVQRGNSVSVNLGINCTASGAAEFDKETLSRYGLQHFLGQEMGRETKEELGFKTGILLLGAMKERIQLELGIKEGDYELVPVGFIRELPRGGKPECMFLIRYKGSAEDVARSVIENLHAGKKEIDQLVYSQPAGQVRRLLKNPSAGRLIQHKGLANLILIVEYMSKV